MFNFKYFLGVVNMRRNTRKTC